MPKRVKPTVAFLLSQVGAHSAEVYAGLLAPLHLSPAHSGIIWMLSRSSGINQQELASALKIHPSRLVGLLDTLEKRGYVERRAHETDRRVYSLCLTAAGTAVFDEISRVAEEHQRAICGSLTEAEGEQLGAFLERIAVDRELGRGVHPGYRWLGRTVVRKDD
jgi:DNA-binding MarR family transcriptional regulator